MGEVFREYSQPWESLARQYIEDVWETTKNFVEQALLYLTDATVSDALLRHLLDPLMNDRLAMAYTKLDELLAVHKEHPETRNHYFTDRYNDLQAKHYEDKTTKALEDAFGKRGEMTEEDIPRLLMILREKKEVNMDLIAAESTFNAMEAFYKVCVLNYAVVHVLTNPFVKVAMKLFIDNVPNLVVRANIASRLSTLFSPKSVFAMSPDTVKKIASETEEKKSQRQEICGRLKSLEAGNDLCKQYALRVTSGQSSCYSCEVAAN